MRLERLADLGKKALLGLSFLALSCSGPTLAKRDYDTYPAYRGEIAHHNLTEILKDNCSEKNFKISPKGFYCHQRFATTTTGSGYEDVISSFSWDEIQEVKCEGHIVTIKGTYDSTRIATHGPIWVEVHPQCKDLEEAFKIYLRERKK